MATDGDIDLDKVMRRIEKLMRTAEGKANEHEAALALQMAQRMADAYNIDIAGVNTTGKTDARQEDIFPGGLYPYQRTLYEAISTLNHCLYWSRKGIQRGEKYRHRVVGSKVNVLLTRQMADYLQSTVERITRSEYCHNVANTYFTKNAHLFREGMVDRIVEKINRQRAEDLADAKRRKTEEQARSNHPGAATGNALILVDDVIERERIANYDFLYGEGAWAKAMAERAEREERQRKVAAEYEEWKRTHPEEWAAEQARQAEENAKYYREEARKAKRRKGQVYRYRESASDRKYYSSAYQAGSDRGREVSLSRQVDGGAKGGLLK